MRFCSETHLPKWVVCRSPRLVFVHNIGEGVCRQFFRHFCSRTHRFREKCVQKGIWSALQCKKEIHSIPIIAQWLWATDFRDLGTYLNSVQTMFYISATYRTTLLLVFTAGSCFSLMRLFPTMPYMKVSTVSQVLGASVSPSCAMRARSPDK